MPTYDYQCRSCGSVTEVIHSMLEEGPKVCERCGGDLRRVLFPAGIIFKGSGFYRTDSRSGGSTIPSGSSSSDGSGGSDGSSGSDRSSGADGSSGSDRSSASDRPNKTPAASESGKTKSTESSST